MNLRQMKKLWKKCDADIDGVRDATKRRMLNRYDKLATTKAVEQGFRRIMDSIGVDGRAYLLARHGETGAAFDLLMRSP